MDTFLHVPIDRISGDIFADIITVFPDIFPRFLEHKKKHGFLIVSQNPNKQMH